MTGSYSSCFKREKSATLVLMAIVVVFIMCQSIKIVPDIWEAVRNEQVCKSQTTNKKLLSIILHLEFMFQLISDCQEKPTRGEQESCNREYKSFEILVSVSVLGVGINSSSNFLIYMLRGIKFRRMAKKMVCRWIGLQPALDDRCLFHTK